MTAKPSGKWSWTAALRVTWCIFSSFVVESLIFGLSVLPAILFWEWHYFWDLPGPAWLRLVVLAMVFIPAYLLFAISLMVLSALATRVLGWRAPINTEISLAHPDWPLLNWVRYMISIHLVRIFAGLVFRATPLWTWYMRLNGARLGRHVFVNSLWVTDHNLLEFDDYVVIGSEAHLSGHTVEHGKVKTAKVKLGKNVVVGVSAIVEIGVEAGDHCQIGALSFVPKYSKLEAGKSYGGIPVHPLESHHNIQAI